MELVCQTSDFGGKISRLSNLSKKGSEISQFVGVGNLEIALSFSEPTETPSRPTIYPATTTFSRVNFILDLRNVIQLSRPTVRKA